MRRLITLAFILFFSSIPMSYAVSDDSGAGIMPGSILYSFDLFFERVELFFAFTAKKKVQVLTSVAEERSSELEALDDDDRERYSASLMARRDVYLEKAHLIVYESSLDYSSVVICH